MISIATIEQLVSRNTLWVQLDKKSSTLFAFLNKEVCRNTLWVQLDKKHVDITNIAPVSLASQYSMSAIR